MRTERTNGAGAKLRAYLVDDELLALKRLRRLLHADGRVEVVGATTDPATALEFLRAEAVDVLFLDIRMPGLNGFELLAQLPAQPMVVFTTAYDEYALRAFEVNSIDYLLKPVESQQLERALQKLTRLRDTGRALEMRAQLQSLIGQLAAASAPSPREADGLICSRVGERIQFIELAKVTHFFSADKLTYAATEGQHYVVEQTLSELEQRLGPQGFIRIHRATLLNLRAVAELHRWFGGRMLVRLKDKQQTELTVARDHVRGLKERLGLR
jgi:two-component system LytT family response regulator